MAEKNDESRRNRGCVGKHSHDTFDAAMRQVGIGKRKTPPGTKGVKIFAYKCSYCPGFHVGHQLNKKPKGKKK